MINDKTPLSFSPSSFLLKGKHYHSEKLANDYLLRKKNYLEMGKENKN